MRQLNFGGTIYWRRNIINNFRDDGPLAFNFIQGIGKIILYINIIDFNESIETSKTIYSNRWLICFKLFIGDRKNYIEYKYNIFFLKILNKKRHQTTEYSLKI